MEPASGAAGGARLPLTPVVHQMVRVGPVPLFAGTVREIEYPIVRDVDKSMYERQHGEDMEVGSYAHRPIIVHPDDIPSNAEAVLSPTEMPFTNADFDPQLADARQLIPELLGDQRVGNPLCHQRSYLDDARRPSSPWRDAGGERALVRSGKLDKEAPLSGGRWQSG